MTPIGRRFLLFFPLPVYDNIERGVIFLRPASLALSMQEAPPFMTGSAFLIGGQHLRARCQSDALTLSIRPAAAIRRFFMRLLSALARYFFIRPGHSLGRGLSAILARVQRAADVGSARRIRRRLSMPARRDRTSYAADASAVDGRYLPRSGGRLISRALFLVRAPAATAILGSRRR